MAYESIPAAYGLNRYLWAKIKEAGILDEANYGGLIPIIPVQETPYLQQAMDERDGIKSYPYIVYSWYQNGHLQDWFMNCDNVVYRINANVDDSKELRQLMILFNDHLKRWDESAQALNDWIRDHRDADDNPLPAGYHQYDYKYLNIQAATGGTPTDMEGAPITAMITVKVEYTTDRDNNPLL